MKKKICLYFAFIISIIFLSGCGISKVPNENALKEMIILKYPECIQRYIYGEQTFEIDKLEIVRRQTNKEEKTDKVDCKISVHNEDYEGVFSYTLHLNYYDEGGWQMDSFEQVELDDLKAKRNTLPKDVIADEVSPFTKYYGKLTFVEDYFDSEKGIITRKYTADSKFNYLTVSGEFILEYSLTENHAGGSYSWVPTYTDNVKQEWKLSEGYTFDAKPQKYTWSLTFKDQVPKIDGADGAGEDVGKGISYIKISNKTNEKIEMTLEVLNRDYDGGLFSDSSSLKNVSFDIKNHNYVQRIFSNRDGDYIELILDADKGIYVEKYSYENNKKYQYAYIPY